MSCKLTYKSKRYNSQEELEAALIEDLLHSNLDTLEDAEEERIRKNSEEAQNIMLALGEEDSIPGLPIVYQEQFVQVLSNKITEKSSIDLMALVPSARKRKKLKLFEKTKSETAIREDFIDSTKDFIENRQNALVKFRRILVILQTKGAKEGLDYLANNTKQGAKFQQTSLYKELAISEDAVSLLAEKINIVENYQKIAQKGIDNVDILLDFAVHKIKAYALANVIKRKLQKEGEEEVEEEVTEQEEETLELRDGDNIQESYDSNRAFELNGKDQLTATVKFLLIGIKKARYKGREGGRPDGEHMVSDTLFMGSPVTVPFDVLYDQLMTIHSLAFKDYSAIKEGTTKFETLMNELDTHVENIPYLKNVIDSLRKATIAEQNAYTTNMNKGLINHHTSYMHKSTKRDVVGQLQERTSLINSATNNSSNVVTILKDWKDSFFDSSFVTQIEADGNVIFDEEALREYFEKAKTIKTIIAKHKKNKAERLTNDMRGKVGILLNKHRTEIEAEVHSHDKEIINILREEFKDLGFDFNTEAVVALYNNAYFVKGKPVRITDLSTSDAGLFKTLEDRLFDKNGKVISVNILDNSIFKDSYIKAFAKYIGKFSPELYASSYKNGQNKSIYGFSLPQYFTDRFKALKTDKKLLKDLSNDVFQGKSLLLKSLYDSDTDTILDTNFSRFFDFFTFDSNVLINKNAKAKGLNKLSKVGMEQVMLNFFYNRGNKFNDDIARKTLPNGNSYYYRNGKLFAPTMADKERAVGLNSMIYTVNLEGEKTLNINHEIIDLVLEEVVYPEYNRILKEQKNGNTFNEASYKNGSSLFYFIPELNYANNHILFEKDNGEVKRNSKGEIATKYLKELDSDAYIKAHLREVVYNHIEALKEEKLSFWEDSGIVVNDKMTVIDHNYKEAGFDTSPDAVAYEFVTNYLISNANFFKLFAGDPAHKFKNKNAKPDKTGKTNTVFNYIYEFTPSITNTKTYNQQIEERTNNVIRSTMDNLVKRLAGVIAPGTIILGERGETMTWAILEDIKGKEAQSSNMEYFVKLFGEKKAKEYYGEMNTTDGMGYSTLTEWARIEHARGNISKTQAKDLEKKDKQKEELTFRDRELIKKVLKKNLTNSYKPVYYNNYKENSGEFRTLYIKQSTLPLTEFLTKGIDLDYLRKAMIRDKISNVVFSTTVKEGLPLNPLYPFDKNGQFKADISFKKIDEEGETVNADFVLTAPREGHKIQLDIPTNKVNITDGSQQRNLIFSDMLDIDTFIHPTTGGKTTGEELRTELNSYYVDVFNNNYEDLKEKVKYNEKTGQIDLEALRDIIKEEFEKRNYPLSDIDYLDLVSDGKKGFNFRQPLWTNNIASKIESLLVSIIDNRIRNIKTAGHSFTLASSIGFKPKKILEGQEAIDFMKQEKNSILYDKKWIERGDFELKGQRVENGEVLPAEILVPAIFRDKKGNRISLRSLEKDGFIDIDKIPEELLTMFGYRVPTQSPNSMSYMKVVGFLPETYSELIIAPAEFTIQMGSDFDIDKLYVNFYNYTDIGEGQDIELVQDISPSINKGEKGYYKEQNNILMNKILDIKFAVLTNPDNRVQKKILSPLDDNVFRDFAREIEQDLADNQIFFSPFSQASFKEKYLSGSTGQQAIGIFARASILNSLLHNSDKGRHRFVTAKGKEILFNLGAYENGTKRRNNALSDSKLSKTEYSKVSDSAGGYTKSDLISMLLSSAVDNANEQILGNLNINSETYNFIVGSIMSGFDAELIVSMINQPVVRDYVELQGKVKDSSVFGYTKENMVKELYDKYKGFIKDPSVDTNYVKGIFADFNTEDVAFGYTTKELRYIIKNSNELLNLEGAEREIFNNTQSAVLQSYLKALEIYNSLSTLQESTNIDGSKGYGKSLIYMHEKEKQIRNIRSISITNTEDFLGDLKVVKKESISREVIKNYEKAGYIILRRLPKHIEFLKPTTITGGMAVYGLFPGNRMYSSNNTMYPYTSDTLESLSAIAYRYLETDFSTDNLEERAELKQKGFNYVRQFLYSDLFEDILDGTMREERERLLVDNPSRPSFLRILKETKRNNLDRFSNNSLLQKLHIELVNKLGVNTLTFDATKDEVQLNFIGDAFLSLLQDSSVWYDNKAEVEAGTAQTHIVYRGTDIAMDLLRHQYVTKGVQFRKQFIKHLPAAIFEALKINTKLRSKDFNLTPTAQREFYEKALEVQMSQHFPDKIKGRIEGATFDAETEQIVVDIVRGVYYPLIARAEVEGRLLEFQKVSNDGKSHTYQYFERAGDIDTGFTEFDSTVPVINSVVKSNKVIEQIEIKRLEDNAKEIKSYFNDSVNWVQLYDNQWVGQAGTREEYENAKRVYLDEIKILAEVDELGNLEIHDTTKFNGIILNTNPSVSFNPNLKEGIDFINNIQETTSKEEEKLTNQKTANTLTEDFNERFNITKDTASELVMSNIINGLKVETNNVTKKYLYDFMLRALPTLIKENPELKVIIYESSAGGGKVNLNSDGTVKNISLNANLLNAKGGENYLQKVIFEEFLHAMTLSKTVRESSVFAGIEGLRTEVLNELKTNNKDNYKTYLKVKKAASERIAIYTIFDQTNMSNRAFKSLLEGHSDKIKKSDIYKDTIGLLEVSDNVDLTQLKQDFIDDVNERVSPTEFKTYYSLINTHEFIAGLFTAPAFQDKMNSMKTGKEKSILERFITYIMKALRRLSIGTKGDTFFNRDIEENSVLEIGIAKTILALKTYNRTIFNNKEKATIGEEIKRREKEGTLNTSKEAINQTFNIKRNNTLTYFNDPSKTVRVINNVFDNLEAKVYKKHYIVVFEKGEKQELNDDKLILENAPNDLFSTPPPTGEETFFNLEFDTLDDIIPRRIQKLKNLNRTRTNKLRGIIQQARLDRSSEGIAKFNFFTDLLENIKSTENRKFLENMDDLNDLLVIAKRDLDEVESIMDNPNYLSHSEILYTRDILENWSNTFALYFTKGEQEYMNLAVEQFNPIVNQASKLLNKSLDMLVNETEKHIEEQTEEKIDIVKSFENFNDINFVASNAYDISRFGNPLLNFVHLRNEESFNQGKREIHDKIKEIEKLLDAAKPSLNATANTTNGLFNVLLQKYKDGSRTGGLVTPFSKEFQDEKENLFKGYYKLNKEEKEKRTEYIEKWLKANTTYFSPSILYGEETSAEDKATYIEELKAKYGVELYEFTKELQDAKMVQYNNDRAEYIILLTDRYNVNNELEIKQNHITKSLLDVWEATNSPYVYYDKIVNGIHKPTNVITDTMSASVKIPSKGYKYTVNLANTDNNKNYDPNFIKVLKDPKLKAFYSAYVQTLEDLKQFLPVAAKEALNNNALPYIEKTFLENITGNGFTDLFGTFKDTMTGIVDAGVVASRTVDTSTTNRKSIDPITGKEERTLDYSLFKNFSKEWELYFSTAYAKYIAENKGRTPSLQWEQRIRKEFNNLIAENQSTDLGKLLKAYVGLSLTYKHKSRIQDTLRSAEVIIESLQEQKRNVHGTSLTDKAEQLLRGSKDKSFSNLKDMYEYYLDVFYGKSKDVEGETKLRVYTSDEKVQLKKIEEVIGLYLDDITKAETDYKNGKFTKKEFEAKKQNREDKIQELEESKEELGGNVAGSRLGDIALKAFQLKGMGWNILAGIGNLGFGVVGNMVEAADGRVITEKEMISAFYKTLNSVGRNFSFHKWDGVNGEALKIRNLMDRNDILKEASHELYTNSVKGIVSKRFGWLLPYNIQKRTEYLNQAPVMIAMYEKTEYEYEEGKFVSLYDAYDGSGQWKAEYGAEPNDLINTVNAKITQFIKLVHGNYDPLAAMQIKKTITGRLLVQFKSWFAEAYTQRWGKEVYDGILDIDIKGRYLSFHDMAKGEGKASYLASLVGLFRDATLRMFGNRKDYEGAGVTEVDAANMRKLVAELSMYLKLMAFTIAMGLIFRDEDEPENEQQALNILLNSINRVTTEMTLFINPINFGRMAKNPAPAMSIIDDVADVFEAFGNLVVGNDEIETGRYAGESRTSNAFKDLIPGLSSSRSIEKSGKEEYNKPLFVEWIKEAVKD